MNKQEQAKAALNDFKHSVYKWNTSHLKYVPDTETQELIIEALEAMVENAYKVFDSNRPGFEEWFSGGNKDCPSIHMGREGYTLVQTQQAWEAWKAACLVLQKEQDDE